MSQLVLQTDFPELKLLARGKVRDIYDLGDTLLLVTSDRISAFDVIMDEPIPDKGFVLTGPDAMHSGRWPLTDREPTPLETTLPRVLAGGDVRAGSTKRVAAAVGEGAQVVATLHAFLAAGSARAAR